MDIMEKIEEAVRESMILVQSIELTDKCIKIKISENEAPATTFKCVNKPSTEFYLANHQLKIYLNVFKNYLLPNEQGLHDEFVFVKNQKLKELEGNFSDEMERKLKEQILAKPSIEKLFIRMVEVSLEKVDDVEIEYYKIHVQGINQKTGCSEEDRCTITASQKVNSEESEELYDAFRSAVREYLRVGRNHYLAYLEYLKIEREKTLKQYVLSASQGSLFQDFELADHEILYLKQKALQWFPEKQSEILAGTGLEKYLSKTESAENTDRGSADTYEETEPSHSVRWSYLADNPETIAEDDLEGVEL